MEDAYNSKVTIYAGAVSLAAYVVGENCVDIEYSAGTSGVEVRILFSTGLVKVYRGQFAYEIEIQNVQQEGVDHDNVI